MSALRVAIIEDEPEFRLRFERILAAEPDLVVVGSASDAAGGRALVARGAADLYLVDLGLPDGDGRDLIRLAVRGRPDVDVLVITVFGDDAHVLSAIEAGATGYLLKDTEPRDVVKWVRTLRSGGSPLNPVIARRLLQRFRAGAPARASPPPSDAPAPTEPSPLSTRESEILRLLAKGLSYVEIGETLGISAHTVTQHIKSIYRKLSVRSRGEAVFEALQMGILAAPVPRR
ncbi:MAG TPA: response regulator transcription factor [Burkholderiaceae bacterium]|nr:response regulator transcription factor [Burkholderiaceae bacterium]